MYGANVSKGDLILEARQHKLIQVWKKYLAVRGSDGSLSLSVLFQIRASVCSYLCH